MPGKIGKSSSCLRMSMGQRGTADSSAHQAYCPAASRVLKHEIMQDEDEGEACCRDQINLTTHQITPLVNEMQNLAFLLDNSAQSIHTLHITGIASAVSEDLSVLRNAVKQ